MERGLKISWDTAESITVDTLHEVYVSIRGDLERHSKGDLWMHENDVKSYNKLLKALKRVLKYYGKDVDTVRMNEW